MAGDAVWLDVLPAFEKFGGLLTKGTTGAAASAGKSAGQAWGRAFGPAAETDALDKQVTELQQAATKSTKAVEAQTQAIAKARAGQRESAAKVAEAEAKLEEVQAKSGEGSKQAEAASLRLEAARERLSGASAKTEATERSLAAAATLAKDDTAKLAEAQDKLGDSAAKSETKSKGLAGAWDKAKAAFGGAEAGSGSLVGKLGALAAAGAGAIAVAKTLGDAWAQALESSQAKGKVQAALGLDSEQAKRAGEAGGKLYGEGFGQSVGDTTAAVGAVMSSISGMRSASTADLQAVTGQALGLAAAFDVDVKEAASSAGILLSNGLAKDATGAFDVITAGLQQIPQAMQGEVLDAINEYSGRFSQLGFDGSQAMALLGSVAGTSGKIGIDKMGDALKEVTIRVASMDANSTKALTSMGLNATQMSADMAAGGDRAKGAFDQIVAGLDGVKDPGEKARLAIQMFGTPLEDLGTDKIPSFIAGLAGAGGGLGDVSGKAQMVADTMSASVDPIESVKRSFITTVAEGLEPFAGPAAKIADWAKENPGLMQAVAVSLGVVAVAMGVATVAMWAMSMTPVALIIGGIVLAIGLLVAGIVMLAQNWGTVWGGIQSAAQVVADWFAGPFSAFFAGIWEGISGVASAAWGAITAVFQVAWDWISGVFLAWWDGIVARWSGPLDNVRKVVEVFAEGIRLAFQWVWDRIVEIWTGISNWLAPYIDGIRSWITEKFNAIRDGIVTAISWVRDRLSEIWQAISDRVHGVVDPMALWLQEKFTWVSTRASEIFEGMKTSVVGVFDRMREAIGVAWDKIKEVFSKPVRWVADVVVNPLIRGFNTLADSVGMPQNKLSEWKFDGFADGGVLPGYTPGRDVHRFISPTGGGLELSGGEAIMRPEWTRLVGGPTAVARMNEEAKRNRLGGFAGGGVWWPTSTRTLSGNYAGHTGVDIAAGMGSPAYAMTPGSITYQGWGRGFGLAVFQRLVNGMEAVYGHLSQSLVSTGQQVAGGQLLGRTGSTGNSSGPHIHVEITSAGALGSAQNRAGTLAFMNGADVSGVTGTGGGFGFDLLGSIENAFSGPMSKLRELGDSGFGGLVKQIPGKVVEGMKGKLTSLWNGVTGAVSGVAAGPLKAMAKSMLDARGWGQHWPALDALIQGESSWNPLAKNASSGAYGLPQSLPGSKMAAAGADWRTNPATQLRWMLDSHIKPMYGNPSNAYSKWLSRSPHWYDAGGWLPQGLSMTMNATGQDEPILTARQWAVAEQAIGLASAAAGRGGGTTIQHAEFHVTVDADDLEQVRDVVELFGRLGFEAELQGV